MVLLLVLFALLALAAPADAATVRLGSVLVPDDDEFYDREDDSYTYSVLRFTASPGERNRLSIRRARGGRILFRDARARVRPGRGCRAAGRAAICSRGPDLQRIRVKLGGGADRLSVSSRIRVIVDAEGSAGRDRMTAGGGRAVFDGGPGNDVLIGARSADNLSGGSGDDRLEARGGHDALDGGRGRDRLSGAAGDDEFLVADGDDDRAYGGTGSDTAIYHGARAAVTASTAGGGQAGEADAFSSIESLGGGEGDDVISGDDGRNVLWGGGGHDRIDGRGGEDLVDLRGASTVEGSVDVACGDGVDAVRVYSGNDRVLARADCESLQATTFGIRLDPRIAPPAGRTLQVPLPCAAPDEPVEIDLVTPAAGRRWFEGGPFAAPVAHGKRPRGGFAAMCPATFELNDAGADLLAARGELPVTARTRNHGTFALLLRAR